MRRRVRRPAPGRGSAAGVAIARTRRRSLLVGRPDFGASALLTVPNTDYPTGVTYYLTGRQVRGVLHDERPRLAELERASPVIRSRDR